MAAALWAMGLSLLLQGCLCSVEEKYIGCMELTQRGSDYCCKRCHPGNRIFKECGRLEELCTPCKDGTFSEKLNSNSCARCTQCVGAQVLVQNCNATTDTKCGCKVGLVCGDPRCSFCVTECGKGHEPTEKRSCRPCPHGTFNDQAHQMCKPWRTKCRMPDEHIVAQGDASTDSRCAVTNPKRPEEAWPFVLSVITCVVLTSLGTIVVVIVVIIVSSRRRIMAKKWREEEVIEKVKTIPGTLIIDSPTDDPRTLIAIECSFHEAEQEQGSSTETLASNNSSEPLIA